MLFEILQHALRVEARVGIVEAGDEAERDHVVFAAVNPRAAVFLGGKRPAHGVDDFAGCDAARREFPEFFHADAIGLRVGVCARSNFETSCFVNDPRGPSARMTIFALRS